MTAYVNRTPPRTMSVAYRILGSVAEAEVK
jgi:hypothetical protein